MPPAPLPRNEKSRLAALRSYEVLDTESEEVFDDIVDLAARLTHSPIALVSLIDAERQWFKARHGLEVAETPRDLAFCAHTILNPDRPLAVEDATKDPRFQENPLVTGAPDIRAYLGVPLVDTEGHALGSLCVIDREAREFDPEMIGTVRTLARAVVTNLELRRALLDAREAALTDALTGLPNRRATMGALVDALGSGTPVAVVTVDLDHFKEANDGEGHAAGDALLKEAAARLSEAVRPGDTVGRTGGDEFVVLLSGVGDDVTADAVAQRISAALHRPVPFGERMLRLGATLGVALAPAHAADAEMLVRVADEALVRAKRDVRGSIGRASPEDAAQLMRAAAILRAFDADAASGLPGATAQLQPILGLGRGKAPDGAVLAVEVLARWGHPDVGHVRPGELFPAIGPERGALLGRVVRGQALAAFAALQAQAPAGGRLAEARLALNLSASEVARADIALELAAQVERAGLSLRAVEIEITEEVLLDRVSDRTLDGLAALRGRGARLVLDDFGTGNSGLAQLLRLPLDGLKLDQRFIQRLGMDVRAEEIVKATVSLAHSLGLQLVAEGIETPRQVAMLRALGCDAVQGFLFARPMTPEALGGWLRGLPAEGAPEPIPLAPRIALRAN
ncbi:putative bifunctional diguanylate cyclase/phosphodiesterase [Pararoseomonas indoligenes]|uniref:EAL domain-containing protein n=1 Tax=Roseomonas indoligenes TaxID=2820811 RepID=A0A940S4T6_9PROT|nr:EAL domain-containing protein [Pararoseomonas indoligenes]MBP0493661.1 EAL domain-containing protein [Pararoseomonas indoligenes]